MTEIVFRPERAPVIDGRNLYRAWMNRRPLALLVRARTAGEADSMLQFLFETETRGKTLFFDLEKAKKALSAQEKAARAGDGSGPNGKEN